MNNSFDMARHWPGKQQTTRTATIELDIRFDLWQDFSHWVDHDRRQDLWHDHRPPQHTPVSLEVSIDGQIICSHEWMDFGVLKITHEFNDEQEGAHDLLTRFVGISGMPVRTDHGGFVCGMFQIQRLLLQGEDLTNLLPDTFFGQDRDLHLTVKTPAYRFILDNINSIWPKQFDQVL